MRGGVFMKLTGYIDKDFDVPIFNEHGFYYIFLDNVYRKFGRCYFINEYLKNRNLQIYKIN